MFIVAILLSLLFAILQYTQIIHWSLLLILCPLWIACGFWFVLFLIGVITASIAFSAINKK